MNEVILKFNTNLDISDIRFNKLMFDLNCVFIEGGYTSDEIFNVGVSIKDEF